MPTRKLIEVALPLDAINKASAREKSIRHGHPSTLHLWWSRKPLAACRAVLFASLVDDPEQEGVPEALLAEIDRLPVPAGKRLEWDSLPIGEQRRYKLFGFIEQLVTWENSNNEQVIGTARALIRAATNDNPPPVYDPFAGGGSIPLEAQRLGLEAHASDLNPVAVLINKALIEIPPKFANMSPVNPEDRNRIGAEWKGAAGLAADVRYYGKWMRDEAEKRIGYLYPKVKLPKEYGGGEATVIAWLWARTVQCPNPACGAQMPLTNKWLLATKSNREAWIKAQVDRSSLPPIIRFKVVRDASNIPEGTVNRRGAVCVACSTVAPLDYVRSEGLNGRMGSELIALAVEGYRGRVYLSPDANTVVSIAEQEHRVHDAITGFLSGSTPKRLTGGTCYGYGLTTWSSLFTSRQIASLTVFNDILKFVRQRILSDISSVKSVDENNSEHLIGGNYADAVITYLALSVSKMADNNSSLCSWMPGTKYEVVRNTFSRQALPMSWDFAEPNPFARSSGDFFEQVERAVKVIEISLKATSNSSGFAFQRDTAHEESYCEYMISTDPPYYDNIGYSDLSDFFYVWLRKGLEDIYPSLFSTLLAPKSQELVAAPYRFDGNREQARKFFEYGLGEAFKRMRRVQLQDYPLSIFYAFKQAESRSSDDKTAFTPIVSSTGWETMLEGLIKADFQISGTWPIRSERSARSVALQSNALASSIVLVCRPRPADARAATRREFLNALKAELPEALRRLQQGNIAPVDLAQAAIGPGMAVFSRYSKVVESDGSPMRVRTALQIINQELDTVLAEQEGEFDAETRWAIAWFDQYGINEGPYGVAETLSKAKNTSVAGMVDAGIVVARGGKVRLLKREELLEDWDPARDRRITVWEVSQYLVHALDKHGESGAAALLAQVGAAGEVARDLAYRLYTTCERKGWAQEALAYNSLVVAWPEITRQAADVRRGTPTQESLFE